MKALPPAIIIWSGKGGVGKSTVASQLALGILECGVNVGFFDADFHGPSAPTLFNTREKLGVREGRIVPVSADGISIVSSGLLAGPGHPMVWEGLLLQGALDQLLYDTDWGNVDVLVVDFPPGTGEIQTALLKRLDIIACIVVTTPHDLSYDDVIRSAHLLAEANVSVSAVVVNLAIVVCPCCRSSFAPFGGDAGERLLLEFPDAQFLEIPIEVPGFDRVNRFSQMSEGLAGIIRELVKDLRRTR